MKSTRVVPAPKKPTVTTKKPPQSASLVQRITYPCGCEVVGPAPMPIDCPTHSAKVALVAKNKIHLTLILDESGSMETCRDATITGVNEYLQGLKLDSAADYVVTLAKFDAGKTPTTIQVFTDKPLADVPELTRANYVPGGGTPMYDGIGVTVTGITYVADRYLVVILTDGEENESKTWNKDSVKKLIAQKEALETWTFVYMGANQDAWAEAYAMGIQRTNAINYKTAAMGSSMNHLRNATVCYSNTMADEPICGGAYSFFQGEESVPLTASDLGSIGGKTRMAGLTPENKTKLGKAGAKARWQAKLTNTTDTE